MALHLLLEVCASCFVFSDYPHLSSRHCLWREQPQLAKQEHAHNCCQRVQNRQCCGELKAIHRENCFVGKYNSSSSKNIQQPVKEGLEPCFCFCCVVQAVLAVKRLPNRFLCAMLNLHSEQARQRRTSAVIQQRFSSVDSNCVQLLLQMTLLLSLADAKGDAAYARD